jgi:hypothetical protein
MELDGIQDRNRMETPEPRQLALSCRLDNDFEHGRILPQPVASIPGAR